jgi:hypothetical protein
MARGDRRLSKCSRAPKENLGRVGRAREVPLVRQEEGAWNLKVERMRREEGGRKGNGGCKAIPAFGQEMEAGSAHSSVWGEGCSISASWPGCQRVF